MGSKKENPPGGEALKQVIKRVRLIPVTGNAYVGTLQVSMGSNACGNQGGNADFSNPSLLLEGRIF